MLRTVLVVVAAGLLAGCEPNNQGYTPEQPIVYSHAVHAGALQVPCEYCHYGAERGRYAGIPPVNVCMNCHVQVLPEHPEIRKIKRALESGEPIRWVRVNHLPDHATFDHSVHVSQGVACTSCHGDVASMGRVRQEATLTMGFCLDCHRQSGPTTAIAGLTGQAEPDRANRLTDCAVCHH